MRPWEQARGNAGNTQGALIIGGPLPRDPTKHRVPAFPTPVVNPQTATRRSDGRICPVDGNWRPSSKRVGSVSSGEGFDLGD